MMNAVAESSGEEKANVTDLIMVWTLALGVDYSASTVNMRARDKHD